MTPVEVDPPNITFRHSWLNVGIMLPPAWGRRSSPPKCNSIQQRDDAKGAQARGGRGVASRTRSSDRLWGLARASGTPRQLFIDLSTEPVEGTQTSVVTEQPHSGPSKRKQTHGLIT
ncbi:hypothetical protein CJ030_MR6G019803 [Morella rubra]|uniref:Uncharacterized protein n=1 Tax=Morella rubra TaxID=262757 RepID=A0A6A1VF38_9ROSI|nr:hypothetical protein CJ030_MR6G019803 [Morella rubra]